MQKQTKSKRKRNYIFSAFSRPPNFPLSVVIKAHANRDIIYITYGGGRKTGGGTWSEDLRNINPRTMNMISKYFSPKIYNRLEGVINRTVETRGGVNNANS